MKVIQDGADFYQAEELPGFDGYKPLWSAPFKVTDHDMARARLARLAFEAWCVDQAIEPQFEGASIAVTLTAHALMLRLRDYCQRGRGETPVWLIAGGVAYPAPDVWIEERQFGASGVCIGDDPR